MAKATLEERFWSKVEKGARCWNWTGAKLPTGYGYLGHNYGKVYAHRLAYELIIGPIPDGLMIDHLCRNTSCVNPWHMEPVTNRENVLRGDKPAQAREGVRALHQQRALQTHCKRGHAFDQENTLIEGPGWRRCRACRRIAQREYLRRKREQIRR